MFYNLSILFQNRGCDRLKRSDATVKLLYKDALRTSKNKDIRDIFIRRPGFKVKKEGMCIVRIASIPFNIRTFTLVKKKIRVRLFILTMTRLASG